MTSQPRWRVSGRHSPSQRPSLYS